MATAWAPVTLVNGTVVSEGEAAGSYPAITGTAGRPALSRYRRLFMWAANKYMLVLDDIRSGSTATFTSLIQCGPPAPTGKTPPPPALTAVNISTGQFNLYGGTHNCAFQVVGSQALTYSIVTSTADNKSTTLGYPELETSATGTSVQLASIYNPWVVSSLGVTLQNQTATTEDIAVTGNGIADTYRWTYATGSTTESSIIPLIAPAITSTAPGSGTVGVAYTFNFTASGSPAPTFSRTSGTLPSGLTLLSTGTLSGTPTTPGVYSFQITASNGVGSPSVQNYSVQVDSTFTSWESTFFNMTQMQEANVSGPNANPSGDGTANLFKYILDINPAIAMGTNDRAGLPEVSIISSGGKDYLTLTYREQKYTSGYTVTLQESTNLSSGFTTVTPDYNPTFSNNAGTDPNNGDPRVQVGVLLGTGQSQFLRLNVAPSP
jgi:hypothetical protein